MNSKEIFFFITYTRKAKENPNEIDFVEPKKKELKPECIYFDEQYENKIYFYNKVYKVSKSAGKGKKGNNFYFEFEINDEKYVISFDSKECTFIYNVSLEVGKSILGIRKKIEQNKEYYEKIDYFLKALEKIGNDSLIDLLYKETIEIYKKKKGFSFLILLFLKIYKKKDLCIELMKIFKEINENPKENEKNMDRKSFLKDYTSKFETIMSESEELLKDYKSIEFYGIILCYLNYYDYENFSLITKKLFKNTPEDLFEILLIYKDHFKYPIQQNLDFFIKFIGYIIEKKDEKKDENKEEKKEEKQDKKKEQKKVEKRVDLEKGLNFIKDLETFLKVIEAKKEDIYKKYNSKKIEKTETEKENTEEIDPLKKKKQEKKRIEELIKILNSIIDFCEDKNTFLIYFTENFWKYVLNYYNDVKQENIKNCFDLRKVFKKYYELVDKIFGKIEKKDKHYAIFKDAKNYLDRDEFAFLLDKIIKKCNENPEVSPIEKLRFITQYNPYYIEEKYLQSKVDVGIFELFDLNSIDDEFITHFRENNFEIIFKEYNFEYIKMFIDKIKNIPNIDTVIKLININKLSQKRIFLDLLNKSYDNIITKELEFLSNDQKLKEAYHIIAKLAIINYVAAFDESKNKKDNEKKLIKN